MVNMLEGNTDEENNGYVVFKCNVAGETLLLPTRTVFFHLGYLFHVHMALHFHIFY
jgi:hypothetical protein